jgi:hypothetical protein
MIALQHGSVEARISSFRHLSLRCIWVLPVGCMQVVLTAGDGLYILLRAGSSPRGGAIAIPKAHGNTPRLDYSEHD